MVTIKIDTTVAENINEATLKQAPRRLMALAQGIALSKEISTLLKPVGWSRARGEEAALLLVELARATQEIEQADVESETVAEAYAACEAFQATGLACARSMLEATHPAQASYLFKGITLGKGAVAVFAVGTFVDRVADLESGKSRKAARKTDREALDLIILSGTSKEMLKALRHQVHVAQTIPATPFTAEEIETERAADARRLEVLRKIYAWVTMWSDIARTVVKRRDLLIRLGLAKRHAKKKTLPVATPPPVTPPVTTTTSMAHDVAPDSRAA